MKNDEIDLEFNNKKNEFNIKMKKTKTKFTIRNIELM
jgi:hypothetical protein